MIDLIKLEIKESIKVKADLLSQELVLESISSLILMFFIFGAVVSFYHFGIEQGFFSESLVCDLGNSQPINKEELLNQLKRAEIVSCKT